MKLTIGYDLPFGVQAQVVSPEDRLRVVVHFNTRPQEVDLRRVEAHVQVWAAGAMYGMAGGLKLPPAMYGGPLDIISLLRVNDGQPTAYSMLFEAEGLLFDPAYLNVLFHKLYCLHYYFPVLKSVNVELPVPGASQGPIRIVRSATSDLPSLYPNPPFIYQAHLDTSAETLSVTAWLERAPTADEVAVVRDACLTWAAQALQGGYLSPPLDPESFYIQPADDIDVIDTELRWDLDEVRLDTRAFNALTHFFAAFSGRFVPVEELAID